MQHLSPDASRIAATINGGAMLEQVLAWSAINTGTANLAGLARQADLLCEAFAALPGDIERVEPTPVTSIAPDGSEQALAHGQHMVLRVRPNAERRILLTGHMDTVFPKESGFQTPVWRDAEVLNGPGVADMKGGLAVILAALTAFERTAEAQRIGYDVLVNSDEETGSLSSAPLIASLAQGKLAALTYEPSALPDGTFAGARGGSGNYSLTVRGQSAHAGRNPQDGRNALVAAAQLVLSLKALEGGGLTVNPSRIDGGSANNVVPDLAVLRFNVRPAEAELAEVFESWLAKLIATVEIQHGVSIHCHGGMTRPPKPLDVRTERLFALVRDCGAALGQAVRWQPSGGVCDGNNIAACGVPVVDTMGVRGGAIHSPDEFLIVPSLAERAALSALVLQRLARGDSL